MRTIEKKIYKFSELSEDAKQKVRDWYFGGINPSEFTELCKIYLKYDYGITTLDIAFSFNNSQGDGLCMYGKLYTHDMNKDLWKRFKKGLKGTQHKIADNEIASIRFNKVDFRYSHANTVNIYVSVNEEGYVHEDKHRKIFDIIEENVKKWYFEVCAQYEDEGYKFFYEIEDDALSDICDANEWEFNENGNFYQES